LFLIIQSSAQFEDFAKFPSLQINTQTKKARAENILKLLVAARDRNTTGWNVYEFLIAVVAKQQCK